MAQCPPGRHAADAAWLSRAICALSVPASAPENVDRASQRHLLPGPVPRHRRVACTPVCVLHSGSCLQRPRRLRTRRDHGTEGRARQRPARHAAGQRPASTARRSSLPARGAGTHRVVSPAVGPCPITRMGTGHARAAALPPGLQIPPGSGRRNAGATPAICQAVVDPGAVCPRRPPRHQIWSYSDAPRANHEAKATRGLLPVEGDRGPRARASARCPTSSLRLRWTPISTVLRKRRLRPARAAAVGPCVGAVRDVPMFSHQSSPCDGLGCCGRCVARFVRPSPFGEGENRAACGSVAGLHLPGSVRTWLHVSDRHQIH